jgi:polysaccharide deacetylase 2 family uncharacterized protein YibQ
VTSAVNFFVFLRDSFISRPHTNRLRLFTLGSALAVAAGGCHHPAKRPGPGEIHAATREFAAAANSALAGADVRSALSASDQDPDSTDRLDITIHPPANETSTGAAATAHLLQALGRVATRHRLTQDSPSESREGILFTYRRAGFATHTIHIHLAAVAASREPAPGARTGHALLAIILDDLGNDRSAADAVFALPYPLTISVLPDRPHSVPNAAGVNNHQGSQSTTDSTLMDELMPVLRDRHLFYIDSRTTAVTVAYDSAHRLGVRAAYRDVPFLDDVAEVPAVRKQLQLALQEARQKGEAVAIGHPHPATLKALGEVLPEARGQGVHLVFASELVH